MTHTVEHIIEETFRHIQRRELGDALRTILPLYRERPSLMGSGETEKVVSDYQLMLDYMARGFRDDQREELYDQLLMRLHKVAFDLTISWRCKNMTIYVNAFRKADRLNMSPAFLQSVLESFVSDMAMLSLEPEDRQTASSHELYERHQLFMNRLFCSLLIALRWQPDDQQFYEDLLLMPTVDRNDQLMIVSAVTLSVMNLFDPFKWQTLLHVCQHTRDEELRQRALVGLVLSASPLNEELYSGLYEEYRQYFIRPDVSRELLELQIQLFYCVNAESDRQKIQSDIMPNLLKNSNLKVTRFGITELEEDTLENIINPNASDKAMEELESSVQKMIQMQRAGSDIYFGGFSQMKRFPFFNELGNWFCPFFPEHPVLSRIKSKSMGESFVARLSQSGPFCHSDKYSFVLGIESVFEKMPSSLREMLSVKEPFELSPEDNGTHTPAFIRRMYLQDLYRFFRLYAYRTDVFNPFAEDYADGMNPYFFLCSPIYELDELAGNKLELARFLFKQKRHFELSLLFETFTMADNDEYLLLYAHAQHFNGNFELAIDCYEKVLSHDPQSKAALKGLARTSMMVGDSNRSIECYKLLTEAYPENKLYQMKYCLSMLDDERFEEVLPIAFKLDFIYPDDLRVKRILAWTLLNMHRLDQAAKTYSDIIGLHTEDVDASLRQAQLEDILNAGYTEWLDGRIHEAASFFRRFADGIREQEDGEKSLSAVLEEAFMGDRRLLFSYGISLTSIHLMIDVAAGFS